MREHEDDHPEVEESPKAVLPRPYVTGQRREGALNMHGLVCGEGARNSRRFPLRFIARGGHRGSRGVAVPRCCPSQMWSSASRRLSQWATERAECRRQRNCSSPSWRKLVETYRSTWTSQRCFLSTAAAASCRRRCPRCRMGPGRC